jgi:PAS domain S-box-containing protein
MVAKHSYLDTDRRRVHLAQIARFLGLVILAVGVSVMLGWWLHIPLLTHIKATFNSMKFNTALLFALSGLAVFTLPADNSYKKFIPYSIALIAGLTLLQDLFGWNLGIDEFFVADTLAQNAAAGRMSVITAINFMLIASSLIRLNYQPHLSQICAYLVGVSALIVLAGYFYNVPALYRVFIFSSVALHTAFAFLLMAAALVLANTESYFMRLLVSDSAGARLIRQVLPITLVLLIATDTLFVLGERAGLYQHEFIMPLNVVASLITVIVVIVSFANQWHETDLRRVVAEAQLRQSYQLLEHLVQERTAEISIYQAAIEASNDLIVVVNRDYRYILTNTKHLQYNQKQRHEVIGHHVRDVVGQAWFDNLLKPLYDRCFAGENIDFEASPQYPELGTRHLLVNYSPLQNSNNEVTAAVVIIRDITERKQAENELRLYQSAVEASSEQIIIVDRNYCFLSVNDAYLQYRPYERKTIIGQPLRKFTDAALFDKTLQPMLARALDGEIVTFETAVDYQTLGRRYILANYSPLYDNANQISGVVGVLHDITERKLHEEETRVYKAAVDGASEFITVLDRDYRYLVVNDAYLNYHQRQRSDLIGRHTSEVVGHDLFEQQLKPRFEKCLMGEIQQFENTFNFPGMGIRHTLATYSPLRDANNQIVGLVNIIHDITERKQAENEMRLYHTAVEASTELITLIDRDYRFLMVNNAYLNYHQLCRDKIIGQPVNAIIGQELVDTKLKAIYERCFAGETLQFENTFEFPTLGERHTWATYSPFYDEQQQVIGIVTTIRDITERKQMELALRENEHKLQQLFEVLPVGVSLLNQDRQIVQVNPALEQILDISLAGLQAGEYRNRRYIHPDGSPMQLEEMPSERAINEQQSIFDVEIGIVKEDNKTIWASVNAAPLTIEGLSAVVVTQDITHRKQVERALEASMEYLSLLTHAMADGIMTVDLKTRNIQFVNQRFCEIFGYSEEELIGQPTRIFYDDDEPHAAFGAALQAAISAGKLPLITERELHRKDGQRLWTSTATSTLTLNGQVTEAISIVRDITERKELETQSRQVEIEQEHVRHLREFITNVSHDLKTPITQIITSLYILKRTLTNDDQQQRIAKMEVHTNNLRIIIDAMVKMTELDAKESFELARGDGNMLLADLMTVFAPLAAQKQQQFTLHTLENLWLNADMQYLHLALSRIIENAINYTPVGGAVTITVHRYSQEYVIEIKDTGVGIAPEDLPRIFERFYRADKARSIGDGHTGMGLAITRKIIQAHHGRIEVTSQINVGSTFCVFLPAADTEMSDK